MSFGQLRRYYKRGFSGVDLWKTPIAHVDLIVAHALELELAELAFAEAMGQPTVNSSRRETVSQLNDAYKEYGISSGIHQTRQLIRGFESAARAQAVRAKA